MSRATIRPDLTRVCFSFALCWLIGWHKKAAQAGDAIAQFNLAMSYLDGDGVPISARWAKYWLEKAAAQRHREAQAKLRQLAQPIGDQLTKVYIELPERDGFSGESF